MGVVPGFQSKGVLNLEHGKLRFWRSPDSTSPISLVEQEFYRYYLQLNLEGPAEQETKLDLINKGLNY